MAHVIKPLIHLWIYNHLFVGISDQVHFFIRALRQHGYRVSVGLKPIETALNVVIENFSAHARDSLISFCKQRGKRIGVIMTEHVDFLDDQILIHGEQWWKSSDYMHPGVRFDRLRHLMDCIPHIRCIFRLGDLPELKNFSALLPGIEPRSIPFPMLGESNKNDTDPVRFDLVFTGAVTRHRKNILTALEESGFSVICPENMVSHYRRNVFNRSARIVLNIPQAVQWRWLSPMRILAGLHCGRATVSVGTQDHSRISECARQLDKLTRQGIDSLRDWVANRTKLYAAAREKYIAMARDHEASTGFPHDLFELWAMTEPRIERK